MSYNFNLLANKLAQDKQKGPFDFYDLDLRDDAMKKMLITASPKITIGNKILLESLLECYNPEAKVKDSELIGLI